MKQECFAVHVIKNRAENEVANEEGHAESNVELENLILDGSCPYQHTVARESARSNRVFSGGNEQSDLCHPMGLSQSGSRIDNAKTRTLPRWRGSVTRTEWQKLTSRASFGSPRLPPPPCLELADFAKPTKAADWQRRSCPMKKGADAVNVRCHQVQYDYKPMC